MTSTSANTLRLSTSPNGRSSPCRLIDQLWTVMSASVTIYDVALRKTENSCHFPLTHRPWTRPSRRAAPRREPRWWKSFPATRFSPQPPKVQSITAIRYVSPIWNPWWLPWHPRIATGAVAVAYSYLLWLVLGEGVGGPWLGRVQSSRLWDRIDENGSR